MPVALAQGRMTLTCARRASGVWVAITTPGLRRRARVRYEINP
jgi:hypothetical protein